jgi:hypothetical protein
MTPSPEEPEWLDDDVDWEEVPGPASASPRPARRPVPAEPLLLGTLAKLVLGGVTEGGTQAVQHLKQWQLTAGRNQAELSVESPDETESVRLRYAMIGLVTRAPGAAQSLVAHVVDASDAAYPLVTTLFSPVTNSRAMRPVWRRYDEMASRGEATVERWIDAGRRAEQDSRVLARQVAVEGTDETLDQVIEIVAVKPEVRDLIRQQTMGMADELVIILRERGAQADARWERRIRRLLGRT